MSTTDTDRAEAIRLWQHAHKAQLAGQFTKALRLYRESLEICPTAEAHTYLGWTLSQLGRQEEAVEQCKLAIDIDPEYGNPYNDIGSYLIQLERQEEAIPWLEKAIAAPRYDARAYPYLNLSRVYDHLGKLYLAKEALEKAIAEEPTFWRARQAYWLIVGKLN